MANMMKNEPKGYGAKVEMKQNPAAADTKGQRSGTPKSVAGGAKMEGGKSNGCCYTHDRKSYQ